MDTPKTVDPAVLKVPDVARLLSLSRSQAYDLVNSGTIPGIIRLGPQCIRIHRETFEKWLRGQAA